MLISTVFIYFSDALLVEIKAFGGMINPVSPSLNSSLNSKWLKILIESMSLKMIYPYLISEVRRMVWWSELNVTNSSY